MAQNMCLGTNCVGTNVSERIHTRLCPGTFHCGPTWLWLHDYNMSGHKCVWTQTCVGINVSGPKGVWSQTCLGTKVSGHKCVWTQTCVGINVGGRKCVWTQTCLSTNVCGHKHVWAQTCLDTNVSGHYRVGWSLYGHKRVVSVIYTL